jgi:hypothetical protein
MRVLDISWPRNDVFALEAEFTRVLIALAKAANRIGAVVLFNEVVLNGRVRGRAQYLAKIELAVAHLAKCVIRHGFNIKRVWRAALPVLQVQQFYSSGILA